MKLKNIFFIFPHQLFKDLTLLRSSDEIYLIEEHLFFNQYKFHKQKLILHRASMKYYQNYLVESGFLVHYIEAITDASDIRKLIAGLPGENTGRIAFYDVCDHWLEKRITESATEHHIELLEHPTPLFINSKEELKEYFGSKRNYFQTDFYIKQRKKHNILIDVHGKPEGGKWSFDEENRLKYPKGKLAPEVVFPSRNTFYDEAVSYIESRFAENYGEISSDLTYPTTHAQSEDWLKQFLVTRFAEFGNYEDAIVDTAHILHHSVLTPMLNIGLLLPMQIVKVAMAYAFENNVPLNSLEGFIRQIIGWREFIRGVYLYKGIEERTRNFWEFKREIPSSFYTANTQIEPVDATIRKVLKTGYNHHIERLMILGNMMLLSEFNPDKVYQWFMEMYVDAYDWVMVPNVYGMSQFADGGLMSTKPYISGSSYVLKMSNYKKGNWSEIWDALFWHFMNKQRNFFLSNPRLGMLIKTYDKMSSEKKVHIEKLSQTWLHAIE